MNEKLAIELDIAGNQCCTSLSRQCEVRQKLDGEVTEVLQQ
jgi:hypothetical protein